MVKQLKKVKIQLGLSVLCKQSKNIERFRVNEMFSRSKICPLVCDGSLNVSTVMKKTAHGEEMAVIGRWLLEEVRLCQITTILMRQTPNRGSVISSRHRVDVVFISFLCISMS